MVDIFPIDNLSIAALVQRAEGLKAKPADLLAKPWAECSEDEKEKKMKLLAQKSAKGSRAKGSGTLGAGLGGPKWGQLTDGQREQRMSELAKASMKQGGVLGPDMEAVAMDGGGLLARMTRRV